MVTSTRYYRLAPTSCNYLKTKLLNKIIFAVCLSFFSTFLPAQQELDVAQHARYLDSNATNPAFFPEKKSLAIGLPVFGWTPQVWRHYLPRCLCKTRRKNLDFGNIINRLDPVNDLFFEQRNEVLNIGLKLPGKMLLHAGYANRLSGVFKYPKSLPELLERQCPLYRPANRHCFKSRYFRLEPMEPGLGQGFRRFQNRGKSQIVNGSECSVHRPRPPKSERLYLERYLSIEPSNRLWHLFVLNHICHRYLRFGI